MDKIREQFEYEAGKALCLPTSIIQSARKGDGYDHAFDSMSVMQPLNGWWFWSKKSRAAVEIELPDVCAWNLCELLDKEEVVKAITVAGIGVKET